MSEDKVKNLVRDKIYLEKEDGWRKKAKIIVFIEQNPSSKAKIQFYKQEIP